MDHRKKVVFITGKDPTIATSGQVSYVRAHARAASKAGYEPHIFCPSCENDPIELDIGVVHRVRTSMRLPEVLRARTPEFHKSFVPWQAQFMAPAIVRFIRSRPGIRLIHAFATWGYVGAIVKKQLKRFNIDTILINGVYTTAWHESIGKMRGLSSVHGYFHRFRHRVNHLWIKHVVSYCERRAYYEADTVVLNYKSVHELIQAEFGARDNVRKLHYTSELAFQCQACDGQAEKPELLRSLTHGRPLIVSVSRHDPRKGLDIFLKALSRLRETGVDFAGCLVSGGVLLNSHRRLATQLKINDIVTISGWVPDISPFLRHADIFVLPSMEEGSGSVALIEALQIGLPVVASRVDGIPEDIVDRESAVLVEPGNVDALVEALRSVLIDEGLRLRLAHNARRTFKTVFSPVVMAAELSGLYEELLKSVPEEGMEGTS